MDYVKKFLHIEGIIGQGAFGRVLVTSSIQNQVLQPQQPLLQLTNSYTPANSDGNSPNIVGQHHAISRTPCKEVKLSPGQRVHQKALSCDSKRPSVQSDRTNDSRFALKCVHPILKPQRLASELRYLRDLGGRCNVVKMHAAHLHKGSLYIVMELIEHHRFLDIVSHLDYSEILLYMKNLLIALKHIHSYNIMHRDIKPANFLYNRKTKKFLLVDFGLAQQTRSRQAPAELRAGVTPPTNTKINPTLASPKTPLTTARRLHSTSQELFPQKQTITNLFDGYQAIKSPSCHRFIQLSKPKSDTPNVATKRQLNDCPNDFNERLKKLKVSNQDDIREPVKLTVGAYESPVTHNDSLGRRTMAQDNKFSTPTIPYKKQSARSRCECRGRAKACITCYTRPASIAPRSGTPGFKAPEILLRHPHQNTAIDIWSAGVIFACLLSGHSPFFRDVDDTTSLAEIITILGSQRVAEAAKSLGIKLIVKPERAPVDIVLLCKTIRYNGKDKKDFEIPDEAFDLLKRMLDPNPLTRITANEALVHPWFGKASEE